VTDLNLQQMPRSEYTPMACVGWWNLLNNS
jgi:hypothetical protein